MSVRIIKLPDIGEGVAEAEITAWHVAVGDEVAEDQLLADAMTDKATVEIPSPVAGRILELGAEVGTVLAVGSRLVSIETEGGAASAQDEEPPVKAEKPAPDEPRTETPAADAGKTPIEAAEPAPAASPRRETPEGAVPARGPTGRPIASPAVRGRALDAGVDLRRVVGSGPAGRILHGDLDAYLAGGGAASPSTGPTRNTAIETVKITGLRRRIAERMAESTRRIPHYSYIEEVDVGALETLRARLNEDEGKPRLTILPFVIRALVVALAEFPQVNALYDDEAETLTRHGAVHVGIATQTPAGLIVPVLKHAEAVGLREAAAEIRRLAEAARSGSATREDLGGSTITITSLGELGGIATTPVINRPEVAIIGINRIAVRPVWLDGQFVPRRMMNLSSSFDHRVIDGYDAARFIQRVKGLLEMPALLFVEA